VLLRADDIARADLTAAGIDRRVWQCPMMLLAEAHWVGVQGGEGTYSRRLVAPGVQRGRHDRRLLPTTRSGQAVAHHT
jgi:GMP synthase PP-ATPase subunit